MPEPHALSSVVPGTRLLGEIITWSCSGVAIRHPDLISALRESGLDESVARELAPRHAFTRACKKLGERRIIRPVAEDAHTITFQFTRESRASDTWEYTLETLLTLEKLTGRVTCPLPGLAAVAQDALDECVAVRTGGDVTRTIQRLFEKNADLFPIREHGGCYFCPAEHSGFLDRVDRFVRQLNGGMRRFPVPAGTPQGDRSVRESVSAGLAALIAEHLAAVESFGGDTRPDTIERAAERIRQTRFKVEAYAAYLAGEKERLEADLAAASGRLRERIGELSCSGA